MHAKVRNLSTVDSALNAYLAEIRDKNIQKDSLRFRRNMERAGEIIAYEISKTLTYITQPITTPLGTSNCRVLEQQPVLATILRAGLVMHQGFLNVFDGAENAFISAYRKHHGDGNSDSFEVVVEYLASPTIDGKTVILCDPMLATGASMVLAYKALLERGKPKHIHIATVIASEAGISFAQENLPENITIWAAAIDSELTPRSYIVPGLGDAGDLAYGEKV
ncbi:MAG: uracil phosphoribosyltransferase [Xanthomonadales bacterium]|nr:uracil phosphoribosyltransferase [Xanthomonadales bacterium]